MGRSCRFRSTQPAKNAAAANGSVTSGRSAMSWTTTNPPAMAQRVRGWATGEGVPLMTATGQGELYLADYGKEVVIMQLQNEELSVNGKNILAFDASRPRA